MSIVNAVRCVIIRLMTIGEKIARIADIQGELTRLRWAPVYDQQRDTELRAEMKQLATPDVMTEVKRRMGVIKNLQNKFKP